MISATDNPFCASISLLSSTKLQPIFFASILPSVDLPAPRRPISAMPENDILRCAEAPPPASSILGLRDLARRRLAQEIADHRPVRRGFGGGNEIFQMRAHRVRHPAQQHDRDVALAAFELRDIAFGNAGDFREHLSRHAAQRPHGADALAELLEKAGFGIAVSVISLKVSSGCKSARFGNIMPMRIDSKRSWWLSMNYNS